MKYNFRKNAMKWAKYISISLIRHYLNYKHLGVNIASTKNIHFEMFSISNFHHFHISYFSICLLQKLYRPISSLEETCEDNLCYNLV